MMNSQEIFEIALGLEQPWFIEDIKFKSSGLQLNIYLDFTKGHKFLTDDDELYTAHDTVERKWQHLNFFQHNCFLHARVPKVKQKNGLIKT